MKEYNKPELKMIIFDSEAVLLDNSTNLFDLENNSILAAELGLGTDS